MLSFEKGDLILLFFDLIILILCHAGLDSFDVIFEFDNEFKLFVKFLSIFLFGLLVFFYYPKFIGGIFFDDCADDLFQFVYFDQQSFVLLGESDSVAGGHLWFLGSVFLEGELFHVVVLYFIAGNIK
jgi:hypothetical protein